MEYCGKGRDEATRKSMRFGAILYMKKLSSWRVLLGVEGESMYVLLTEVRYERGAVLGWVVMTDGR